MKDPELVAEDTDDNGESKCMKEAQGQNLDLASVFCVVLSKKIVKNESLIAHL